MSDKYKFKNPDGLYFITFTVVYWVDVFTRIEYKDILLKSFDYCQSKKGLEIFAWCIMSNHVHLLVRAEEGKILSDIIRDLKKFSSTKLIEAIRENPQESKKEWMLKLFSNAGKENPNNSSYQFWQNGNHQIELWSVHVIEEKLDYIHQNPVKAGWVSEPEHYLYSSAKDYGGENGILKIKMLW
jgi:putative transposase